MNLEVLTDTEYFSTKWKLAFERFCPRMQVHMLVKASFTSEGFVTTFELTLEFLFVAYKRAFTALGLFLN